MSIAAEEFRRRIFSGNKSRVNMEGRYIITKAYYNYHDELIIRDIKTGDYWRSYTDFGIEFDSQNSTGTFVGYLATRDYVNDIIYVASKAYYDKGTLIFQNGTMTYYEEVYKLCTPDGKVVETGSIDGTNGLSIDGNVISSNFYSGFNIFDCVGDLLFVDNTVINLTDYSMTSIDSIMYGYDKYTESSAARSVFFL